MNEHAVYNESDLAPFHRRLNELRQIIQHGTQGGKHGDAVTKLLERQLNECGTWCKKLNPARRTCVIDFLFIITIITSFAFPL